LEFDINKNVIDKYPEMAVSILAMVIIYKAEFLYHKECVRYCGFSDEFKHVENGMHPPDYEYELTPTGFRFVPFGTAIEIFRSEIDPDAKITASIGDSDDA